MKRDVITVLSAFIIIFFGWVVIPSLSMAEDNGNNNSFVKINSADFDPANVSQGQSINFNWDVSYKSPGSLYSLRVFISETNSIPNDPILQKNCGSPYTIPNSDCQNVGHTTCNYNEISGFKKLTCMNKIPITRSIKPGTYNVFVKACIWDELVREVCDDMNTGTISFY